MKGIAFSPLFLPVKQQMALMCLQISQLVMQRAGSTGTAQVPHTPLQPFCSRHLMYAGAGGKTRSAAQLAQDAQEGRLSG